jgi:hypothetical protein
MISLVHSRPYVWFSIDNSSPALIKHPHSKTFVGLGDFYQVAPVTYNSSGPSAILANSIYSSDLWPQFEILHLIIPICYAGDPTYAIWVD